jgi:hypothetical protein
MKNIETLLAEARKIISKEHLSASHKTHFNARANKRFRKFFVTQCMTEIGEPFKERVTGYMPAEYKAM